MRFYTLFLINVNTGNKDFHARISDGARDSILKQLDTRQNVSFTDLEGQFISFPSDMYLVIIE